MNARETLRTLLLLGAIPVINENDTVATAEIRFGDNDSLAALVVNLVEAEALILLTDQQGVFDKDPRAHQDAKLIDSLIFKFELDKDEFTSSLKPINVFKEKYTVALMFPFLSKTLEPTTSTKVNQNILDLYLGIKMAVDTLQEIGIKIDLRCLHYSIQ